LNGGIAELRERQVDPFFAVFLSQPSPAGAGRRGREQGDVWTGAIAAGGGQEALFERLGEIERAVAPDIGNCKRRVEEQRAAVAGQRDAWTDQLLGKIGGE